MAAVPTNATGWSELYDGNIIQAAFKMYDTALTVGVLHLFVFVLFLLFQFMVIIKTRNMTVAWITGIFFISLYATGQLVGVIFSVATLQFMFVLLVMELAGILYFLIFK